MLGGHPATIEPFCLGLANLERTAEGPERLVERFLPFVRVHAFGQRLRRMLKSLDAHGMVDPDTGLLANEAFWRISTAPSTTRSNAASGFPSRASPSRMPTAASASMRRGC